MQTTFDSEKPKHSAAPAVPAWLYYLSIVTGIGVLVGVYLSLAYAGQDVDQGDVQRIFYIHMPSFIGAFVAFTATVVGGVQYLRTRKLHWDSLALAGVEVGLALALVNLATGSVWARPIWNTWWTWDPRLTSAAIMALTYAAYLMLRAGIENVEQRRRFAAVYGIVAIISAIITLIIIRIRPDTIHPAVIGTSPQEAQGGFRLATNMLITLIANMVVWGALVPVVLIGWRMHLERLIARVDERKARFAEK